MVDQLNIKRVGFIVEGDSEKTIVESTLFKNFLKKNSCDLISPVIDARGGGNLLPNNIDSFIDVLKSKGVDAIYVLTDLEDAANTNVVREKIQNRDIEYTFIAVKALEAWYLADTKAMRLWLDEPNFHEQQLEQTNCMPWDRLRDIAKEYKKRGPGASKLQFAKKMVEYFDFSIESAANHPECPSARELVNYFSNRGKDSFL